MATLNKVQLIGYLGKDPEVRTTGSGMKVCNLSVATSESFTKDGAKQEHTEWHRIIVFNKAATACGTCLKKGSMVYIEGKIQTKKFQNKQGVDQYQTEIVASNVQFFPKKDSEQVSTTASFDPAPKIADNLEDIPF